MTPEEQAVDEYLRIAPQVRLPAEERLGRAIRDGAFIASNPDAEAKARQLAAATGAPLETVRRNPQAAEQVVPPFNVEKLTREAPGTARFLSDAARAAIARDDAENLSFFERSMRAALHRAGLLAIGGAQIGNSLRDLVDENIRGLTAEERANRKAARDNELRDLRARAKAYKPPVSWEDWKDRPLAEFIPLAVQTGIVSIPDIALAITSPFLYGFVRTAELAMDRAEADNRDPVQPTVGDFVAALPAAAASVVLERLGAEAAIGVGSKLKIGAVTDAKSLAKAVGFAGAVGAGTEFLESGAEYTATRLGTVSGFDEAEFVDTLAQGLVMGAGVGSAIRSVTAPIELALNRYRQRQEQASSAPEMNKAFTDLMAAATASKLRERDPQTFQEFIEELSPGQTELYADAAAVEEALFQSGLDDDEIDALFPGLSEGLQAAAATGGITNIPISELLTRAAGTPLEKALLPHLKVSPDSMSLAEAEAYTPSEATKELQAEIERVMFQDQAAREFADFGRRVEKLVLDELNKSGRFSKSTNATYASLYGAFAATNLYRLRDNPVLQQRLLKMLNLRVENDALPKARDTQEFDQTGRRLTNTPEFRAWFGNSVVKEPVFHATAAGGPVKNDLGFTIFRTDKEMGAHFGTAEQANVRAKNVTDDTLLGARIYPVWLSIQNPLRLPDIGRWDDPELLDGVLEEALPAEEYQRVQQAIEAYTKNARRIADPTTGHVVITDRDIVAAIRNALIELGYDGIVYRNQFEIELSPKEKRRFYDDVNWLTEEELQERYPQLQDSYIAFDPSQIKSVFNRGTFDPNSPDILEQTAFDYEKYVGFRPAEREATLDDLATEEGILNLLNLDGWAILTAENPNAKALTPEENAKRNAQLEEELQKLNLEFKEVKGHYRPDDVDRESYVEENSYVVVGIDEATAIGLAEKFGQESVLTRKGLVYPAGYIYPATGISFHKTEPDNYFSTIRVGNKRLHFAVDLDFDQRLPLSYNPEAMRKEAEEEANRVRKQLDLFQSTVEPDASWTRERIDQLIRNYGFPDEPEKSKAYAAWVTPDQFLGLTLSRQGREILASMDPKRTRARPLDVDEFAKVAQPIFLVISPLGEPSNVQKAMGITSLPVLTMAHEGRHRMTALKAYGVQRVPVVILLQDKNFADKPKFNVTLSPQRSRLDPLNNGDTKATLDELIPISYANRDRLIAHFGADAQVMFQSEPDAQPEPAPPFYSPLERAVYRVKEDRMKARAWAKKLAQGENVTAAEIEFTNVIDVLEGLGDTPMTRQAVLDIVQNNAIQIEELPLGDPEFEERMREEIEQELLDADLDNYIDAESGELDYEGLRDSAEEIMRERGYTPSYGEWRVGDRSKGKRYRELLFRWGNNPGRIYDESHFGDAGENVFLHVRFDDRTDVDGNKVLFLHEVQSTWNQTGRDEGFERDFTPEERERLRTELADAGDRVERARNALFNLENTNTELVSSLVKKLDDLVAADPKFGVLLDTAKGSLLSGRSLIRLEDVENEVRAAPTFTALHDILVKELRPGHWMNSPLRGWLAGLFAPYRNKPVDPKDPLSVIAAPWVEHAKAVDELNNEIARAELAEAEAMTRLQGGRIPRNPFTDVWHNMALKRMIHWAAANGYDKIAWTTGAQQRALYDRGEDTSGFDQFYDETLVNAANKILKKLGGGKVETVSIKSIGQQPGFTITPEVREAALRGMSMFQNSGNTPNPGERNKLGRITLPQNLAENPTTITLLENANLSTFLHETGHFFFEILRDLASQPDAPAEIKADMDALLANIGIKAPRSGTRLDTWNKMTFKERVDGHEKMARSFEAYLYTGKAPSVELDSVFQKLARWLKSVYYSLIQLRVNLTPEVRSVFDRMLATDEQIAEAEAARSMLPLFRDAESAGMTPTEWEAYQRQAQAATDTAAADLNARGMRDMRWTRNKHGKELARLKRLAAETRKAVRAEVEAEVRAEPVYIAMEFLKKGLLPDGSKTDTGFKLSIDELEIMYPDPATRGVVMNALGTGQYGMAGRENAIHPDQAAELLGFTSGDHLVRALVEAMPMQERIDALTEQRLLEEHGELANDQALAEAADAAIHNEVRARMVATEINAINAQLNATEDTGQTDRRGRPRRRRLLPEAARQFANATVSRLKVRNLKPSVYAAAAARAARNAEKAMAKGDRQTAVAEKRNQLFNLYAAAAATKAQSEIDKALRYFERVTSESARKKIDADYREQIEALLDRYDLRRGQSLKAIDKRKSLLEWVEEQRANGFDPIIPEELISDARRIHYKNLTVDEMRDLVDAVRNIEHLGRLKKKLLTAKDKRELDAIANDVAATIRDNATASGKERIETASARERLTRFGEQYFALHRKWASLFRQMAGGTENSVLWKVFVRPMNEAADREARMREEATMALLRVLKPVLDKGGLRKKMFIPEINTSLSYEARLAIALNWGNEQNRQRIMDGDRWSRQQVEAILKTLTAEDHRAMQAVRDYLDSFWPEVAAKERRVTGVVPERVEALPFEIETSDGQIITLRGGYYPIKYDPDRSDKADADSIADIVKQSMLGAYTRATTRRGHTKQRLATVNRPVRKDLGVLFQHITEVIHDLTHHEMLIDMNRLLGHSTITSAIREHYGPETLRALKRQVEDVAAGDVPAQNVFEAAVNHLRTGVTIIGMGWNLMTGLLQPLGLTQSMARIGPKYVAKGIGRWLRNAASFDSTVEFVESRSDFMRLRAKTMQREINEIRNQIAGKSRTRIAIEESFFILIAKLQRVADYPTWLGAYEAAYDRDPNMDDETASRLADQAVLDSQGGGQIKDLAGIQRGGPLMKLWTNFYSYFNVTYNLLAEQFAIRRKNKDYGLFAGDVLLLLVLPSVLATLLREAVMLTVGGEPPDEEELIEKVVKDQLGYLFGTMVGLREIGSAITSPVGYNSPAGLRFFVEVGRLVEQAEQGEVDEAFLKAANNTAGMVLHYPAGQVQRTVTGVQALAEGDTKNPVVLLTGKPPDR